MDPHTAPPSYLADRRRHAAMRSSPAAPAATSRPTLGLADVVSIGTGRTVPAALDAPKVQANQRLYLPECLAELGWQPATGSGCGPSSATRSSPTVWPAAAPPARSAPATG